MVLQDPIVIVGAARTPIGSFQGELKEATAPELGATAIRAALRRSRVEAEAIEEVVFGCVLPAGQGQAPAAKRRSMPACPSPLRPAPSTRCAAQA